MTTTEQARELLTSTEDQHNRAVFLRLFVPGKPAPQGSKSPKGVTAGGRVLMAESSKALGPWRARIAFFAGEAYDGPVLEGVPLAVTLNFVMPRPAVTPKRKPTPPAVKRPDIDKLVRGVHDALCGVVYADDSAIVVSHAAKRLAEPGEPYGVHVLVTPARGVEPEPPHPCEARPVDA